MILQVKIPTSNEDSVTCLGANRGVNAVWRGPRLKEADPLVLSSLVRPSQPANGERLSRSRSLCVHVYVRTLYSVTISEQHTRAHVPF